MGKCKVTTYMFSLQSMSIKRERDDALRARLAHITLSGKPIGSLTHDESLPGGYLGTPLTASLSPEAHLHWTKTQLTLIGKARIKHSHPTSYKTAPPLVRGTLKNYSHTLPHGPLPALNQGGERGA